MSEEKTYKVGDKIVEFGQVFRIFKIETYEDGAGKIERILHFRPFFKSNENKGMVCSIPETNLKETKIRPPISRDNVKELILKLSTKPKREMETDINTVKEALGHNDVFQTALVLRTLWVEKTTSETFTKSKKDMLEMAVSRLVEEVALVVDLTLDKADDRIKGALAKVK